MDYSYIEDAIEPIKRVYKELLKMKYEKRMGEQQIGSIMSWSQSQINKKKWKLIEMIADFDRRGRVS